MSHKEPFSDFLKSVYAEDVQVGDVVVLDPVIGREYVAAKTKHRVKINGKPIEVYAFVLKSSYMQAPGESSAYDREPVVRTAHEPIVVFIPNPDKEK